MHRSGEHTMDVSSDLTELGKTPVAVICAGVKSILDIGRTLEYLVNISTLSENKPLANLIWRVWNLTQLTTYSKCLMGFILMWKVLRNAIFWHYRKETVQKKFFDLLQNIESLEVFSNQATRGGRGTKIKHREWLRILRLFDSFCL